MSKKKKININPAFFNITPKKGGKRKEKKTKPKTTLKINNVKKALMKKVKEHRQKKLKLQNNHNISNEQSEFQSSLNYLETISKQNKKKKKSNIFINNNLTNNNLTNNSLASPSSKNRPAPPFGILKGGKKPLYSQYKKTLKSNVDSKSHNQTSSETFDIIPYQPSTREKKLEKIKQKFQDIHHATKIQKKRRLIRRTLGKRKKKKIVSVLINCKKSRKRIKKYCQTLNKKSLAFMKKKLQDKGLLKIGSPAPENIITDIYISSELSGDIYNKNGEILLHNYMTQN